MKLTHYSDKLVALSDLRVIDDDNHWPMKPVGFWVSDDDCEQNWHTWCMQEQFCLDHLTCVHDVELVPNANVLILRSAEEIDRFNAEWTEHGNAGEMFFSYIAWSTLRQKFDGLIVTPYIWDRRLAPNCMWYYGFDCASGCIWHPTAIRSITLRQS